MKMSFEDQVYDAIMNCLVQETRTKLFHEIANFYSGTLFVKCDENTARSIFNRLIDRFGLETVRINKCGEEYAYDFV
jgi:hypothetical protein